MELKKTIQPSPTAFFSPRHQFRFFGFLVSLPTIATKRLRTMPEIVDNMVNELLCEAEHRLHERPSPSRHLLSTPSVLIKGDSSRPAMHHKELVTMRHVQVQPAAWDSKMVSYGKLFYPSYCPPLSILPRNCDEMRPLTARMIWDEHPFWTTFPLFHECLLYHSYSEFPASWQQHTLL